MARTFSYNEAARLLGGQDSGVIQLIDRAVSMAMLALGVSGVKEILDWFEPEGVFIRCSNELIADIKRKIGPARGKSRTEILTAAHSIIVITAYFEMFKSVRLPFNPKRIKLTKDDELTLATGQVVETSSAKELLNALLNAELPIPSPYEPTEVIRRRLRRHYEELSARLIKFLTGLALWDELDDTTRNRVQRISSEVPRRAVDRYEELFVALAAQCPEFFAWANLHDHEATRRVLRHASADVRVPLQSISKQLNEFTTGLERMEYLISKHVDQANLTSALTALAQGYRAALERPIVETTSVDAHAGLNIPSLGKAYVDPAFRLRRSSTDDRPAEESWWENEEMRNDLPTFLTGFFTSPYASDVPLVVLGQPGSGKSVLTRVLAARLPSEDFVVIRVELRAAPANAPIQDQIETAIRQLTGEQVSYPDLVRAADGALPVILLDGFDELLQSTGVNRSNYLEQVREFQMREAAIGRPVAIVVTTRTVVAERARFPQGSVALRLEPFGNGQVERWLSVWNHANQPYYQVSGIRPLNSWVALRYKDLATQPLLLLMLALFDADANALERSRQLDEADVYEGLLLQFARREIVKLKPQISPERLDQEISKELERLGIVAFAMFNRGRQWVHDFEVDKDLQAVLGSSEMRSLSKAELDEPLTDAQLIIGRFFFIHESQASFKDSRARTFEFLHATFGEYLVARLVSHEIQRLCRLYEVEGLPLVQSNGGRLNSLLSFTSLTTRTPVLNFLNGLFGKYSSEESRLSSLIVETFLSGDIKAAHRERGNGYEPLKLGAPAQYANWTANLVMLRLLNIPEGGAIAASALFGEHEIGLEIWQSHASLWKSQLGSEAWRSIIYAIHLERHGTGKQRDALLSLRSRISISQTADLRWSLGIEDSQPASSYPIQDIYAEANLLCDPEQDLLVHTLRPVIGLKDLLPRILQDADGETISGVHLLLRLCMQSSRQVSTDDCVNLIKIADEASQDVASHYLDLTLNCCQNEILNRDHRGSLPVLRAVLNSRNKSRDHTVRVAQCAIEALGRVNNREEDSEVTDLLQSAIRQLNSRTDNDHLVSLWVAAVECGLSVSEISDLKKIERFVHEVGEERVHARVNRARLRRAIRLTS
jgi:hypothetical protein